MTKQELIQLLHEGEGTGLEFKSEIPSPSELSEEIIAFANTEGGRILFGVGDDGSIVGVHFAGDIEEHLMNICRNNCLPALNPAFEIIEVNGKTIAVLQIPKGADRPYRTTREHYYVRVGTTKRRATKEELGRLFQDAGIVHYDLSPVPRTSIGDIDMERFTQYYTQLYEGSPSETGLPLEQLLENMEIATIRDNRYVLTLGGLVCFGKNPQQHLRHTGIAAVRFKGDEISELFVDRAELTGTLPQLIDDAEQFVLKNTKVAAIIQGFKREEMPQYPIAAVRESIVNAVAHRDYSIAGSKIRLFIFENRIEVYSPGNLPNTITLDTIMYRQFTRNQLIVKFLNNLKYIDELGAGIPRMIRLMKQVCGTSPKFALYGDEFCVTLYGNQEV